MTVRAEGPPAHHLDSVAGPLLVPDLPVFLWYPDGFSPRSPEFASMASLANRVILNSACDWGQSDPLKVRKTADRMLAAGFTDDEVDKVVWRNPVEFYGQSQKLDLSDIPAPEATFAGSSHIP